MRKQFVKSLESILETNSDSCLLLGDIGVFGFRNSFNKYPNRVYNIGILEQSTISVAAGLSKVGLIPFVHTIAPFLVERCLEQLKLDFGYQNLNGNFITVGNSYDYSALGSTHHCPGDVQQLLTIPNMEIVLPGTSYEFDQLIQQSFNNGQPTYYRLSEYENKLKVDVKFGKANVIKKGKKATIICVGNTLDLVEKLYENEDITLLYYTTIKPFDTQTLLENFNENIILIEPYYKGGINFLINQVLEGKKYKLKNIGVPHTFLRNYGTKNEHDNHLGLTPSNVSNEIENLL